MQVQATKIPGTIVGEVGRGMTIGEWSGIWLEKCGTQASHYSNELGRWLKAWSITSPEINLPRPCG